jgi:hypothetical protein
MADMLSHWRITRRGISYLAIFAIFLVSAAAVARSFTPSASAQQKAAGPSAASVLTLRHWAFVRQDAKLIQGSSGARSSFVHASNPTIYSVTWGVKLSPRCVAEVTAVFNLGPAPFSGQGESASVFPASSTHFFVSTFGSGGNNSKQPFYIALFCP